MPFPSHFLSTVIISYHKTNLPAKEAERILPLLIISHSFVTARAMDINRSGNRYSLKKGQIFEIQGIKAIRLASRP